MRPSAVVIPGCGLIFGGSVVTGFGGQNGTVQQAGSLGSLISIQDDDKIVNLAHLKKSINTR